MFKIIRKKIAGNEERERLLGNIFSLSALQGVNYILPLLTVPYLVRVLGAEYFGLLAFASATIAYFTLITDYGFNLSATRQVSIYRDDKDKLNEIFSSVMMIKALFLVASFSLMSVLVFSIDKFHQYWEVYFVTFGLVVGQSIFPIWLFQGLEKMKYITYINVCAKAIFTLCIFVLVKNKNDYLLVPLATAIGSIFTGVWSLYIAKKEFSVVFSWKNWESIKFQLVDGWHVFLSSISISFYTISTTFILGFFASNTIVGYFSAAEKILIAVKGIYQPVAQAIYPLIGKKIVDDRYSGLAFIRKTTKIVGFVMLVISLLLFVLAEPIVVLLLGAQYQESVLLLKIMSFLPFIIALNNIYGIQTMLNLGFKRAFSLILAMAAILGITLSLILVPSYYAIGTVSTLVVVETFVTVSMFLYLRLKLKEK